MFSFYFFLKKVEMFFDPDAALARALSFAVMLGLAACNINSLYVTKLSLYIGLKTFERHTK